MNDPAQIALLLKTHAWLPLSALAIGLVVRLLKSDTKLPINLPARYRPWLALGLGVVAGVLDKASSGTDWPTAIVGGLLAGAAAIVGHDTLVESLRGGKEFPVLPKDPPAAG